MSKGAKSTAYLITAIVPALLLAIMGTFGWARNPQVIESRGTAFWMAFAIFEGFGVIAASYAGFMAVFLHDGYFLPWETFWGISNSTLNLVTGPLLYGASAFFLTLGPLYGWVKTRERHWLKVAVVVFTTACLLVLVFAGLIGILPQ